MNILNLYFGAKFLGMMVEGLIVATCLLVIIFGMVIASRGNRK